MFIENWSEIYRIFISALIAYFVLIIILRISGKRTLSKWNIFDFIVTIALGSLLADVIVSKNNKIAEGLFAAAILIVFQFLITFLSTRFDWIKNLVKAKPTLLYYQNEFLDKAIKSQRVTKSEILAAMRSSSIGAVENVEAVVLEADGGFSVIEKSESEGKDSALEDVEGIENFRESD
jgi:uncharacterized membrane protein YcaP (DUF421 family)